MIINSSVTDLFRIDFFKGMLKKVPNMHTEVRKLLTEKMNDAEKITTDRLIHIILKACAEFHDIHTVDRMATDTAIFREVPYHIASSLLTSLPVLETLLARGYNLAEDKRLFHDFFKTDNIDIIKFYIDNKNICNNSLNLKIANTSVLVNGSEVLQFLASKGIPYHLVKISFFEVSPNKDVMDKVVFLMGVGVDFSSIKNKAVPFYMIKPDHSLLERALATCK